MKGYLKFGALVLVGALLAVLVISYRPAPESPLRLALDKAVYKRGEPMVITIKNISDEVVVVSSQFPIIFEKWENGNWTFYSGTFEKTAAYGFMPGETLQREGDVAPKTAGRYRIFMIEGHRRLSNFVEFEVVG